MHLSGIIHDVGKIGIEAEILRKAEALTDVEYEFMKEHPTKGAHRTYSKAVRYEAARGQAVAS